MSRASRSVELRQTGGIGIDFLGSLAEPICSAPPGPWPASHLFLSPVYRLWTTAPVYMHHDYRAHRIVGIFAAIDVVHAAARQTGGALSSVVHSGAQHINVPGIRRT